MAIDIKYFRKRIKTILSRDFVQKIVTKYESTDFANKTTDNGSNFRTIDAISEENKTRPSIDHARAFFDKELKTDYLVSRGLYHLVKNGDDINKKREIVAKVTDDIRESLDSKNGVLTLNSGVILDNPQIDSPCHILTINTDGESIISVVKAIYEIMKNREIPFDIEIPRYSNQKNGYTEAIKLNVTTADLEATIRAINSIDQVYKDKIKAPNLFNANVDDLIGYDSLLDIDGERSSDKLGVIMIKAIDMTIAELGEGLLLEDQTLVDYVKHAENKDEARKLCLAEIKKLTPNIIDPILVNVAKVVKDEKIDLNLEDVFESDIAFGELNAEFGALEEEQEIENHNEVEYEDTEKKTDSIAKSIIKDFKAGVKAITSIDSLLTQSLIRPAINFGPIVTEENEEEKTEPKVTVVEPIKKEENALPGEKEEKEEEIVDDNPIMTRDGFKLDYFPAFLRKYSDRVQKEQKEEKEEGYALPGEENYASRVINKLSAAAKEKVEEARLAPKATTEVEPKEENVVSEPIVKQAEEPYTRTVKTEDMFIPEFLRSYVRKDAPKETKIIEAPVQEQTNVTVPEEVQEKVKKEVPQQQARANEEAYLDSLLASVENPVKQEVNEDLSEEEKLDAILNTVNTQAIPVVPKPVEEKTTVLPVIKETPVKEEEQKVAEPPKGNAPKYKPYDAEEARLESMLNGVTEDEDILSTIRRETVDSTPGMLTTEEKIAVVADSIKKTTQEPDYAKEEKIAKYRGVSLDPQLFDFKIRNDEGEVIQVDEKEYTVLDYLEKNNVLSYIPLDSRVYLNDDYKDDSVDGRTFIREYVIPSACNGNIGIEDIIDRYVSRIVKSDEFDTTKKKGIFGFMRK